MTLSLKLLVFALTHLSAPTFAQESLNPTHESCSSPVEGVALCDHTHPGTSGYTVRDISFEIHDDELKPESEQQLLSAKHVAELLSQHSVAKSAIYLGLAGGLGTHNHHFLGGEITFVPLSNRGVVSHHFTLDIGQSQYRNAKGIGGRFTWGLHVPKQILGDYPIYLGIAMTSVAGPLGGASGMGPVVGVRFTRIKGGFTVNLRTGWDAMNLDAGDQVIRFNGGVWGSAGIGIRIAK